MELAPDGRAAARPVSTQSAAYHAYLKGRYYWNMLADSGVEQAIAEFQRATQLDPSSASAHAALARALVTQAEYYGAPPRPALEAARHAATRAVELDQTLFEGHLALGEIRRLLEWDWRGAEAAYSRAVVLNPSHEGPHRAYAMLLASQSRLDEAIRESERACDTDPLCVIVNSSGAAWVRYLAGDYAAAIARSREAVEMEPKYLAARRVLAAAYLQAGREPEAIAVLEGALAIAGDDAMVIAALAHARAVVGERDVAAQLIQPLTIATAKRHLPSYHLAVAFVGLGDATAALDALERAFDEADPALIYAAVDPRLDPLRSDGRFIGIIDRLGL
jgi:tetratricopeptide (TPR) repeat protein